MRNGSHGFADSLTEKNIFNKQTGEKMKKQLNIYLSIGILGVFVFGSMFIGDIYEAFYGSASIWWTHQDMKLPLEKTKDQFEIWINGKLLQKRLEDRSLYVVDADGNQYPVVSKDVGVRINNWDSRQAEILKFALVRALITGICLGFLLAGIFEIFRDRKARSRLPG
jgi:hypothetical protein